MFGIATHLSAVSLVSRSPATIILYTDEQTNDIKRLSSCDTHNDMWSVLGVDHTFSLSLLYLTLTIYKNKSVKTCTHAPLFQGPMMLHDDGQYRPTSVSFQSCEVL